MKLKAYTKAYEDADNALKIDSSHFKSLGRRGTANYYLGKVKQAKIDFIGALKSDPQNIGFLEYIKKCDERLQKIKNEALEKIERRVMFTDLEEMGFEEHSRRVPVHEMRLDQKVIHELQQKKEQVVKRQNMEPRIVELDGETGAAGEASKKKNKKKNKKSKKNKGLAAFMDDDEIKKYNAEEE